MANNDKEFEKLIEESGLEDSLREVESAYNARQVRPRAYTSDGAAADFGVFREPGYDDLEPMNKTSWAKFGIIVGLVIVIITGLVLIGTL